MRALLPNDVDGGGGGGGGDGVLPGNMQVQWWEFLTNRRALRQYFPFLVCSFPEKKSYKKIIC